MNVISAVVLTQNVSGVIERCLRGLAFADEIVVVDAESDDDTVRIALSHGAKVITNPWPGFAEQRRFGLSHARGDWIFMCDSDEEVSVDLGREIVAAVDQAGASAFRVRRRNQFLGEWMDHGPWARDYQIRLVRADVARISEQSVHEGVVVDGPVATLASPLYHYTHESLSESVARLNRYTTLESRDRAGRRRVSLADPFFAPAGVFLRYYLRKGCWRAGRRGFLLAAVTAMYKSVLYVKIYLLQRGLSRPV